MAVLARRIAAAQVKPALCIALAAALAGCASRPPVPDWQTNARLAMDDTTEAVLRGDTAAEQRAFARARAEVARTGDPAVVARIELMRCAAHVASLQFGPCAGFEAVRVDAGADERAYAAYLQGQPLSAADVERLPPAQRPVAAALARGTVDPAAVRDVADPQSRLIAIAVAFQAAAASPAMMAVATETASAQGWRRPLLAWLKIQAERAAQAGDETEAARLRRRVTLVENGR